MYYVPAINQHLKTIFSDGEVDENSVIKKYLTTAADGKHYNTKHYNFRQSLQLALRLIMIVLSVSVNGWDRLLRITPSKDGQWIKNG